MGALGVAVAITALMMCCGVEAGGPWCFVCKDVFHPAICQYVAQCGDHEQCHTEKIISNNGAEVYTSSCKDVNFCTTTRHKRDLTRSQICSECCNGTLCNGEGCNAPALKTAGQTYCLKCGFIQTPSACDKVDVCSVDRACSISEDSGLGITFYKLGCRSKSSCPKAGSTLAKDRNICCQTDLCNSNENGVSPSRKPAPPQVSVDNVKLVYKRTYAANEIMELVCHVTGGPLPSVTWTFDNGTGPTPVKSGFTSAVTGDSVLSVPAPDGSSSGIYSCQASNPLGKDFKQIDVQVKSPPQISGNLNISRDAQFQDDVTLECNVTADNSTSVHWEIPQTVKSYSINTSDNSLTLYNVHSENNAEFMCVAENGDGNTTKTYSLSVNDTSIPVTTPPPCTCPNVTTPTCPTLPTTTTPTPTTTRQITSTSGTPSVQRMPSSSGTSTPPTTSTTPTTAQMTSSTAAPTTHTMTTSGGISSSTPPGAPAPTNVVVRDQFQSHQRQLNILVCPNSMTGNSQVTWHRLVQDYDHSNPVYKDNSFGVLTISKQVTILKTGVYECRVNNVPIAQFAVYGVPPNNVQCGNVFGDLTSTPGAVMKAWCPPCNNPLGIRLTLVVRVNSYICESAIAKNIITKAGGNVTYLMEQGGEVTLIDEKAGNILVK